MHDVAVADVDTGVAAAVEGDDITGLQRTDRHSLACRGLLVAGTGDAQAHLLIRPLHETRAVECVRAGCAYTYGDPTLLSAASAARWPTELNGAVKGAAGAASGPAG